MIHLQKDPCFVFLYVYLLLTQDTFPSCFAKRVWNSQSRYLQSKTRNPRTYLPSCLVSNALHNWLNPDDLSPHGWLISHSRSNTKHRITKTFQPWQKRTRALPPLLPLLNRLLKSSLNVNYFRQPALAGWTFLLVSLLPGVQISTTDGRTW